MSRKILFLIFYSLLAVHSLYGVSTQGGDWLTRVRALYILPNSSSSDFSPLIPNAKVNVHPCWTGELDIGYMLSNNLGLELMLTTYRTTLVGSGILKGVHIGNTFLFPPTLTLQWHCRPFNFLQSYLGIGVNYTLFYRNQCSLIETNMSLKHSWGPAAQIGVDFFFFKDWLLNLDIKYLCMNTPVLLKGLISTKIDLRMDPWVFGFGIGRKW